MAQNIINSVKNTEALNIPFIEPFIIYLVSIIVYLNMIATDCMMRPTSLLKRSNSIKNFISQISEP